MNAMQVNIPPNGKAKEPMPVKIVSIEISFREMLTLLIRFLLAVGFIAVIAIIIGVAIAAIVR